MARIKGGSTIGGKLIAHAANFRSFLTRLTSVSLTGDVTGAGTFDANGLLTIGTTLVGGTAFLNNAPIRVQTDDDVNLLLSNAYYNWGSVAPINAPGTYGVMLTMGDSSQARQICFTGTSTNQKFWMRRNDSGTWKDWVQFISVSNLLSQINNIAASITGISAANITTGVLPGTRGSTATTATSSFLKYNAYTRANGVLYGGTTNPINATRLNYDGYFYATRVYNAYYNDLAEYMYSKEDPKEYPIGTPVMSTSEGLVKAEPGCRNRVGVVSGTYGYALGAADKEHKIPVGISGRVLIQLNEDPADIEPGDFIAVGPNHTTIINNEVARGCSLGQLFDGVVVEEFDGKVLPSNMYWMMITLT